MHGLIHRAIQTYVTETYGADAWVNIARASRTGVANYESMLVYPDEMADQVLDVASDYLGREQATLLEDMGTFFITDPRRQGLRRLLRFGGSSYRDFLYTIDDLMDWGKLAVKGLVLPQLNLQAVGPEHFLIFVRGSTKGMSHVLVGMLRAMADDYGALVMIELEEQAADLDRIVLRLAVPSYQEPREFELASEAVS